LRYGRHVEEQHPTFWAFLKTSHHRRIVNTRHPTLKGVTAHFLAVCMHFVSTRRLLALKHSGLPVLICVGTHDLLVRASNSSIMFNILNDGTNAKMETFENVGHAINNHQYVRFNTMLAQFVREAENDYRWEAQSPHIRPILPAKSPALRARNARTSISAVTTAAAPASASAPFVSPRGDRLFHPHRTIESFATSLRTVRTLSLEYFNSVYVRLRNVILACAVYGFLAWRAYRHYLTALGARVSPSRLDRSWATWKSLFFPLYLILSPTFRGAFLAAPFLS
jgi:hypothetical protein